MSIVIISKHEVAFIKHSFNDFSKQNSMKDYLVSKCNYKRVVFVSHWSPRFIFYTDRKGLVNFTIHLRVKNLYLQK